jgi:P-type Ca2+ transporter type 2C
MKSDLWYELEASEVIKKLNSSEQGLEKDEADRRRQEYGLNALSEEKEISWFQIALKQFKSPLIYVLLLALIITLSIKRWEDSIIIAVVLFINGIIGFFQESKAENAIRQLMQMISPQAKVQRAGKTNVIKSSQIVPGDIVCLEEGDIVPADLRLIKINSLQINEASLTGESVPVHKTAAIILNDEEPNLADQHNMAFMGTAVTSGSGLGIVVATAAKTQIGLIAESVKSAGEVKTPLQTRIDKLAQWIVLFLSVVISICFVIGLSQGNTLEDMFLLSVSLAVSAIPSGLPIVMSVALAIGVKRMAERNAIIRKLPAVETLGSTTVIVSDKTGTITQNKMEVSQVLAGTRLHFLNELNQKDFVEKSPLYFTLLAGALNNKAQMKDDSTESSGDPMDLAMLEVMQKFNLEREVLLQEYELTEEIPFETDKKFSATIHNFSDEKKIALVKGAPEKILSMCSTMMDAQTGDTTDLPHEELEKSMNAMAADGLRVLAMAVAENQEAIESLHNHRPKGMVFVGAQGLLDPPRDEAASAIKDCHESGIRVMMITGDHAETALSIARKVSVGEADKTHLAQAGDKPRQKVLTGHQIDKLDEKSFSDAVKTHDIFARANPGQKLRIVRLLKKEGEIVAVTGDGVNDAPALKEAHLGVAMGKMGTDVAKEASDMVITDDNFASIYEAVKNGRTAFRNIRMATYFLLSTGVAEVLTILVSLILHMPLPLIPSQILWLNVATNSIQDVSLAFEPGDRALYQRSPRSPQEGILDWVMIERTMITGLWLALCSYGIFWWQLRMEGSSLFTARVVTLTTLVLVQLFQLFNCRSENVSVFKTPLLSNKILLLAIPVTGIHVAALYWPKTQKLLSLEPISLKVWLLIIPLSATVFVINELHKFLQRKRGYGFTKGESLRQLGKKFSLESKKNQSRRIEEMSRSLEHQQKQFDTMLELEKEHSSQLDELLQAKRKKSNQSPSDSPER